MSTGGSSYCLRLRRDGQHILLIALALLSQ